MRSEVPGGDLAAIIEQAITEKLERLEARRFARTSTPRKGLPETDPSPSSRHIPAAVQRAVRERDQNRCRYLTCRAHNTYLAEHDYGREAMARHRASGNRVSEAAAVYSAGSTVTPALASPRGA